MARGEGPSEDVPGFTHLERSARIIADEYQPLLAIPSEDRRQQVGERDELGSTELMLSRVSSSQALAGRK
jgi:hypothetical protein